VKYRALVLFLLLIVGYPRVTFGDYQLNSLTPLLSSSTRLLVVSPHPDDGILGAGGAIQRVRQRGGFVKVVYMTSGDGYPAGISQAEHIVHPLPEDYRNYGALRRTEALNALHSLRVRKNAVVFLGFPDGGLCPIFHDYWADKPPYYQSPYTHQDRPLPAMLPLAGTEYDGEDLKKELSRIILDFRPTLVMAPHPRDQHPDHCATSFFVREALRAVAVQDSSLHPIFLRYLIHFDQWPMKTHSSNGSDMKLTLPANFPESASPWLPLPLTTAEINAKRNALLQYHSQMLVMGDYLLSFVRANELFSPAPQASEQAQEVQQCCGQFIAPLQAQEVQPSH
jgi:LmbE family N-acetylglucosaminyl deacetylase